MEMEAHVAFDTLERQKFFVTRSDRPGSPSVMRYVARVMLAAPTVCIFMRARRGRTDAVEEKRASLEARPLFVMFCCLKSCT